MTCLSFALVVAGTYNVSLLPVRVCVWSVSVGSTAGGGERLVLLCAVMMAASNVIGARACVEVLCGGSVCGSVCGMRRGPVPVCALSVCLFAWVGFSCPVSLLGVDLLCFSNNYRYSKSRTFFLRTGPAAPPPPLLFLLYFILVAVHSTSCNQSYENVLEYHHE